MNPPGPLARWVLAARPRTLPAAVVPVAVGLSAVHPEAVCWGRSVECAVIALGLQVGTNYHNDYEDGVRGTDSERVGPFRLTASGLVEPRRVRAAALVSFGVAAAVGLVLAATTSWWLVVFGLGALVAGWAYTGGPRPYGYLGLGEVFVFAFFGLLATVGTSYVQDLSVPGRSWWLAVSCGAAACCLLEANNLRDVAGDSVAGKKTLAVRLGRRRASWLYAFFVALLVVGAGVGGSAVTAAVALALYVPALVIAFSPREGRALLGLLVASARAQLALGAALVVTCWVVR